MKGSLSLAGTLRTRGVRVGVEIMTVDDWVEAKVPPEYRELAADLRQAVRDLAPDAVEEISYGMPCYKRRRIFAYLNAGKDGLTLSFTRGVQIEDSFGLLHGKAKGARFLKLKRLSDLNREALADYMRQALALDEA